MRRHLFPAVVTALLLAFGRDIRGASPEPATKIMPLGDSITAGDDAHRSYRSYLWHMLRDAGYSVDFVGHCDAGEGVTRPAPDFDADHEGHWGWRTDAILQHLDAWLSVENPDVVLLHLGTNDLFANRTGAEVVANLDAILATLRKHNPHVTVLVAQLIPYRGGEMRVRQCDNEIEQMAREDTPESRVIVVDQWTGFDWTQDTHDGIHANEQGGKKMAQRWFDALKPLLKIEVRNPEVSAASR